MFSLRHLQDSNKIGQQIDKNRTDLFFIYFAEPLLSIHKYIINKEWMCKYSQKALREVYYYKAQRKAYQLLKKTRWNILIHHDLLSMFVSF